jgi:hypothetical protein
VVPASFAKAARCAGLRARRTASSGVFGEFLRIWLSLALAKKLRKRDSERHWMDSHPQLRPDGRHVFEWHAVDA